MIYGERVFKFYVDKKWRNMYFVWVMVKWNIITKYVAAAKETNVKVEIRFRQETEKIFYSSNEHFKCDIILDITSTWYINKHCH